LWGNRVVIPEKLKGRVLEELQQTHVGIVRMKAIARCYVWWENMDHEIEEMCKSCRNCVMLQSNPCRAPIHVWEFPANAWERVHIDYAGPFLGKMFLIIVDAYSKWLDVRITSSSSATATIEELREVFAAQGLPLVLVSDNGPAFISEEFVRFMKFNGVKHIFTAPYHPASNGQAERTVRSFKETMKKMQSGSEGTLRTKVNRMLFAYRTTPHSTTGVSPAEMLNKRRLRTSLGILKPNVHANVRRKQFEMESRSNIKSPLRDFAAGDTVLVRNFGQGDRWLEGVIVRLMGAVDMEVRVGDRIVRRHFDQVRRCPSQLEESHDAELSHEPERTIEVPTRDAEDETESMEEEPTIDVSSQPHSLRPEENLAESPYEGTEDHVVESLPAPRRSGRERRPPSWLSDYQGGTK
jgi:hypothetical protein